MRSVCLLAALAASVSAASSLAQTTGPLELSSDNGWSLDYGQNSCRLDRSFSSADGEVTLQVEQMLPGHSLHVTLASNQLAGGSGAVSVTVGPGTVARTAEAQQRGRAGSTNAVRFSDPLLPERLKNSALADAASLQAYREGEAAIGKISFENAFERPVILQVGSMANAMNALRTCVDDLLVSWNMDPAGAPNVAVPPVRVGQMNWARRVQEAYPRSMVREGRSAIVHVVLAISADGSVSRCHAHNPQPYPDFELTTCEELENHARYEPARDAAGNAVPGFDSMDVTFSLSP